MSPTSSVFPQETESYVVGGGDTITALYNKQQDPAIGRGYDRWGAMVGLGEIHNLVLARNGAVNSPLFLRTINGVTTSLTYGILMPHDGVIVYVTSIESGGSGPLGADVVVYKDGVELFRLDQSPFGGQQSRVAIFKRFEAGTELAVEVTHPAPWEFEVGNPIVTLGIRWGLTYS